jgi:hypothetical protein
MKNKHMRCDECNCDVAVVDGVTAIWSRGYWWCIKHCQLFYHDEVAVVNFPSLGKLIPNTILWKEEMMGCPTNKEEWWKSLEENWDNILHIFYQFLPMHEHCDYKNNITAIPLSSTIQNLKNTRNSEIARYLNRAWAAAPDHISIHSIPSWGELCDLCSEEYCLYEDKVFLRENNDTSASI